LTTEPNPTPSPWLGRAGLALSALPIFGLGMSASMKFMAPPEFVKMFVDHLGGALAAHVRIGEFAAPTILLGLMVWGGLYLRDARLRDLLPLRRKG